MWGALCDDYFYTTGYTSHTLETRVPSIPQRQLALWIGSVNASSELPSVGHSYSPSTEEGWGGSEIWAQPEQFSKTLLIKEDGVGAVGQPKALRSIPDTKNKKGSFLRKCPVVVGRSALWPRSSVWKRDCAHKKGGLWSWLVFLLLCWSLHKGCFLAPQWRKYTAVLLANEFMHVSPTNIIFYLF